MPDQQTRQPQQPTAGASKFSETEYRDLADFRCALRTFMSFSEQQARAAGITPQQHLLLLLARGHRSAPRVNIGELADALQVRHHSASLLVDRCVKRGLVERREDPDDRRRALVSLTPAGQDVLDTIIAANQQELGELEEPLFRDTLIAALRSRSNGDERKPSGQ